MPLRKSSRFIADCSCAQKSAVISKSNYSVSSKPMNFPHLKHLFLTVTKSQLL